MRRHTVTNWFYLCSRAVHCTTDAVLALPEYKPSVVWMICKNILLIAGHLKTQVMCLNVRVVNQLWKSCAFFAICIYGRDIITRDCIKMSLWRAAAQERARTWVCGLLAVRRCQSLQGLRYPSKHPAALIPLRLLFLARTNVWAPHLKIATSRPRGRGTPSTVSLTVHTQFHPMPIFSLLWLYWSKKLR